MISASSSIGCLLLLASLTTVSGLCSTCLEERCYDNGECIIGCVPGYFGEYCDEDCPSRCLNKACYLDRFDGTVTCTDGCEPGYCDIQCTEPCPGDCATCDRQCDSCNVTLCPERYYGSDCSKICDERYGKCDRETGQCIICRRGFYGDECRQECTACFTRADTIRDTCLSGCDICQSKGRCPAGFHGESCEVQCSSGCDKRGCNRATGECSTGCVSGYHGLTCNYTCSEHCLSRRCDRTTGECSTGCVSGYHGLTCNYTCSRFCVGGVCNQHDGVCTSGCINGYRPNKDVCEQLSNEVLGSNKAVAIAVPIALVCLVAVMVTAAVIWRRRRYRRSNTPGTEHGGETVPMLRQEARQIKALAARTKDEIDFNTAGMIRVSAVDIVLDKLRAGQRWVTITGNAGDGKTVLGYLVLKEFLQKKVKVFTVNKPEEYDLIAKMRVKKKRVIMFDDRFGAFLADQQLINSWLDVIGKCLSYNTKFGNNSSVIFLSRKNVLNESRVYLGKFTDQMFDKKCVVDLSLRKETKERLNILEYHLQQKKVTVNRELKKKVADKDIAHGFPHCCEMYSKLRSNKFVVDIEEFFESPLKFLDMTTKVLYKDNCKDLFQMMVKNDGEFDVNTITDEHKRHALLQVEKEQEGSYITVWKNGICKFAHPSVYESVLNVINDFDPLYCVQYATLSVIRQKMIISDEEDNSRAPCYIIVKPFPAVLKALAERFTQEEILKGDYSVFKHRLCKSGDFSEALVSSCVTSHEKEPNPAVLKALAERFREELLKGDYSVFKYCKSREFCEALLSCCVTTHEEESGSKQLINQPGTEGDTMMLTAVKSGHMAAVQSLVKAGADVDIPDETGKSPLHYLCLFSNSGDDVADRDDKLQLIITEGRGDVNKPDRYGQTPLHCLCQVRSSAEGHDDRKLQRVLSCAQFIITKGRGDVNISDMYGQTPLHYFFKSQALPSEEIKWIITEGKGDLNQCEQNKITPLHYLCAYSDLQLDTVDLVINEGKGDFNKGDKHGTTPLHYLSQNENVQFDVVLRIVNTARGDLNKQDNKGITPLHVLCKGPLQMKDVLTLIKEGDKADSYGNTPLHFLCRRRGISDEEILQLKQLPESNMKKHNKLGHTPLGYLNDQGQESVPMLPQISRQVKALVARNKDEIKIITSGMIRVSAVDIVLKKLREGQQWITITGNAGDGKTVLGYMVLKEFLNKKVNVFTVDKPEEYYLIAKMKGKKVILFDERFGAFLADQQLIKSWLDVIRKLLSFNEHDKIKSSVIFVSRKNVVNESRVYLGKFTDHMFDPECVVDLSLRKGTEERLNILEYHLHHENVTVNHELKKKVADKDIVHGFPHCCKMYSKLRSNGFNVDIEEFFESPLKFLDMRTKVLYKDNCKDLFQMMVKNDGEFDVYTITDEDKRQELLQVEKEQEGSYITKWKNGICKFAHPSVYESVLNVINDIDPLYIVQYATLSVIREKMIISTSDEEDSSRAPCYIIVKPINYYRCFKYN